MTAYANPYTTAFNIKDRAAAPRLVYDPTLDPTRFGWEKPTVGKASYLLSCDWIAFTMRLDYLYNFRICEWERVWVVYPVLIETSQTIGEPIIYGTGCDLDALTDALIDHAGNIEDLLTLIQLQNYEARAGVSQAHEASKADWLTDNLPATDSRPDNTWGAPEFGGERYGLHRSEF